MITWLVVSLITGFALTVFTEVFESNGYWDAEATSRMLAILAWVSFFLALITNAVRVINKGL